MDNKEPLLRSDWTTYRGGALFFDGAEDCAIEDCDDRPGRRQRGLRQQLQPARDHPRLPHRRQAGANGVAFVGDPKAVRSPLFDYDQRQSSSTSTRRPARRPTTIPPTAWWTTA